MSVAIATTPRSALRRFIGVQTHWDKPGYQDADGNYDPNILQAIVALKPGWVRQAWWPKNPATIGAIKALGNHHIKVHLTISNSVAVGDMDAYVQAVVDSGVGQYVWSFAGLNEPNSGHRSGWAAKTVNFQKALFEAVNARSTDLPGCIVVGPSLMHEVNDLRADYDAIAECAKYCTVGNFHVYTGIATSYVCEGELELARRAFGKMDLLQTESGRTRGDTSAQDQADYWLDWSTRMFHYDGCLGVSGYESCDEDDIAGRESEFGIWSRKTGPWAAYTTMKSMLAPDEGAEKSPVSFSDTTDCQGLVTSEGGGKFTLYLTWPKPGGGTQATADVILAAGFSCDKGRQGVDEQGKTKFTFDRPSSGALCTVSQITPS